MVVVLGDHVAEHAARHLLEDVVADPSATPGDLFPDEDSEPVAVIENAARLLIVGETDEVRAHFLDEVHLLIDEVVGHGGCVACMVFVAMSSAEEESLAVELEGAVLDPLGVTYAEGLLRDVLAVWTGEGNAAYVEIRGGRAPEDGCGYAEGNDFGGRGPRFHRVFGVMDRCALLVENFNCHF